MSCSGEPSVTMPETMSGRLTASTRAKSPPRLWPTIAFCIFALGSFGLLTLALRKLDVGPAYAVWTGIGAAGTAIYGMVFLGDLVFRRLEGRFAQEL